MDIRVDKLNEYELKLSKHNKTMIRLKGNSSGKSFFPFLVRFKSFKNGVVTVHPFNRPKNTMRFVWSGDALDTTEVSEENTANVKLSGGKIVCKAIQKNGLNKEFEHNEASMIIPLQTLVILDTKFIKVENQYMVHYKVYNPSNNSWILDITVEDGTNPNYIESDYKIFTTFDPDPATFGEKRMSITITDTSGEFVDRIESVIYYIGPKEFDDFQLDLVKMNNRIVKAINLSTESSSTNSITYSWSGDGLEQGSSNSEAVIKIFGGEITCTATQINNVTGESVTHEKQMTIVPPTIGEIHTNEGFDTIRVVFIVLNVTADTSWEFNSARLELDNETFTTLYTVSNTNKISFQLNEFDTWNSMRVIVDVRDYYGFQTNPYTFDMSLTINHTDWSPSIIVNKDGGVTYVQSEYDFTSVNNTIIYSWSVIGNEVSDQYNYSVPLTYSSNTEIHFNSVITNEYGFSINKEPKTLTIEYPTLTFSDTNLIYDTVDSKYKLSYLQTTQDVLRNENLITSNDYSISVSSVLNLTHVSTNKSTNKIEFTAENSLSNGSYDITVTITDSFNFYRNYTISVDYTKYLEFPDTSSYTLTIPNNNREVNVNSVDVSGFGLSHSWTVKETNSVGNTISYSGGTGRVITVNDGSYAQVYVSCTITYTSEDSGESSSTTVNSTFNTSASVQITNVTPITPIGNRAYFIDVISSHTVIAASISGASRYEEGNLYKYQFNAWESDGYKLCSVTVRNSLGFSGSATYSFNLSLGVFDTIVNDVINSTTLNGTTTRYTWSNSTIIYTFHNITWVRIVGSTGVQLKNTNWDKTVDLPTGSVGELKCNVTLASTYGFTRTHTTSRVLS
jgi:hypothetical protein